MLKINLKLTLFAFAALGCLCLGISAQDDLPAANQFREPGDNRGDMIARALELSEDQQAQIVLINLQQRKQLRLAQQRMKTAREAADQAIYKDDFNQEEIAQKVQAVAEAQAMVTGIRLHSEIAVRKVLTPEQLVKFRNLRARFAAQRKEREAKRKQTLRRRRQNNRQRRDVPRQQNRQQ